MGNVANDSGPNGGKLPAVRELGRGLSVAAALELGCLRGARVLAGHDGLHRIVSRLNVMEVPDILPWVREQELLLTTGYPLRNVPGDLAGLVTALAERNLAGIAVKLGRYLDELPPDMLRDADRVGLPVIALPSDVGFDEVINQVLTEVLNGHVAMLARAEEVHRALVHIVLTGGDLDELCEELVGLSGGAVMVTSADGRVLAAAAKDDALEHAMALDCFDPSGRFLTEREPIGIQQSGEGARRRAVVRIVAGSLDHGRLVAFSTGRDLNDEDVHILERAATVAALAITKSLAVSAVESKYQGDFLRDVLSGRAGTSEQVTAHASSLGWDLGRRMVVIVAETDPEAEPPTPKSGALHSLQNRFAMAWAQAVRMRDGHAPVVGYSQEVVAVIGVDEDAETDRITGLVKDIVRDVRGDGGGGRRSFSTGISRAITGAAELPQAYQQARRAASVGRQMQGESATTHFDGLGMYRLLSLIPDTDELHRFVSEALGELIEKETADAVDLRTTLRVLLDTNLNVAETARILHFHYNTLRYRIGKLERMLGPFMTDPSLRLTLSLALRVVEMRGI